MTISSIIHSLEKKGKGLAAFPGILGYKAYLPRGVRFLGERYLTSSNLGAAETEAFIGCYFCGTHFCRCVCIYLVCFCGRVAPTLTASALPCCPRPYLSPCRNLVTPIIKGLRGLLRPLQQTLQRILPNRLAYSPFMVEVGGIEPPSRTPFNRLHTAIQRYLVYADVSLRSTDSAGNPRANDTTGSTGINAT